MSIFIDMWIIRSGLQEIIDLYATPSTDIDRDKPGRAQIYVELI